MTNDLMTSDLKWKWKNGSYCSIITTQYTDTVGWWTGRSTGL